MNPHTPKSLRSLLLIAVVGATYIASRWFSSDSTTSIPYIQTSGYIEDTAGGTADRYHVVVIQRESQNPWLIVAQRIPAGSHFAAWTTSMSSKTTSVSVNGTEYHEIAGQTIIAIDDENGVSMRCVLHDPVPTIALLPHKMANVRVADFESLFPEHKVDEPSDVPEPSGRPF